MLRLLRKLLRVKDNDHVEFWVTHAFLLASTVLGVYLAASAGLDSAIKFERVNAIREAHNLRTALLEELEDNVELVESWLVEFDEGRGRHLSGESQNLDLYIWEAMGEHPATFDIDGSELTAVRRYYRKVGLLKDKLCHGSHSFWPVKQLREATAEVRSTLLESMRSGLEQSAALLATHGVEVRAPAAAPQREQQPAPETAAPGK